MLEECGSLDRHSSNSHRSIDRHSSSRQSIDRHSSNSRQSIERVASSSNKTQPRGASVSLHRLTADNSSSGTGAHIDADMYAQVRPASADPRTAMYHHMGAQDANVADSYHQRRNALFIAYSLNLQLVFYIITLGTTERKVDLRIFSSFGP